MKKIILLILFFFSGFYIFSQNFPLVMYVNTNDGLNQRKEPQLSSEKVGTLLYGERVILTERSTSVTIDGITDYWYKMYRQVPPFGWCWVFGGYLSNVIPLDVEPILGRWDTDRDNRNFWDFSPNHKFRSARKGPTDMGTYGNWTLVENILTLELIPVETMSYNYRLIKIELIVIDKDNIHFLHENGTVEKLIRNNNVE